MPQVCLEHYLAMPGAFFLSLDHRHWLHHGTQLCPLSFAKSNISVSAAVAVVANNNKIRLRSGHEETRTRCRRFFCPCDPGEPYDPPDAIWYFSCTVP